MSLLLFADLPRDHVCPPQRKVARVLQVRALSGALPPTRPKGILYLHDLVPKDEDEEEDLEKDPEADGAYVQDHVAEEEELEQEDDDDEQSDNEQITAEELREVWAAGWKAKDQVAEKRKARNFRLVHGERRREQKPDARKQSITCSGCGQRGHWRGDPTCPGVKSGEDQPCQPKSKPKSVSALSLSRSKVCWRLPSLKRSHP